MQPCFVLRPPQANEPLSGVMSGFICDVTDLQNPAPMTASTCISLFDKIPEIPGQISEFPQLDRKRIFEDVGTCFFF